MDLARLQRRRDLVTAPDRPPVPATRGRRTRDQRPTRAPPRSRAIDPDMRSDSHAALSLDIGLRTAGNEAPESAGKHSMSDAERSPQ